MKILIADDDHDFRENIQSILENAGHSIVTAGDGAEAVVSYQQNNPDFVITDYSMPRKNWVQVIIEIRAIKPDARIWLASSSLDESVGADAKKNGAEITLWKADIISELKKFGVIGGK